jgi:hypothetical protein
MMVILHFLNFTSVGPSYRPFVGASQGVSLAPGTFVTTASSSGAVVTLDISSLTSSQPTPDQQPSRSSESPPSISSTAVNDKYFICDQFSDWGSDYDIETYLEQVKFFEDFNHSLDIFQGLNKGRLARHIHYWENLGASSFIIDTIKNGYVIPFLESPSNMFLTINRSALHNEEFVSQSVI